MEVALSDMLIVMEAAMTFSKHVVAFFESVDIIPLEEWKKEPKMALESGEHMKTVLSKNPTTCCYYNATQG